MPRQADELTLAIEPVAPSAFGGGFALAEDHWDECGLFKDHIPLDLDWDKIFKLEEMGMWKSMALRRNGVLLGYSNWIVGPTLHYRSTVFAQNDSIFLAAGAREGYAGIKLIRGAEEILRGLGVKRIDYHARPFMRVGKKDRPLSELFERLGYSLVDRIHSKILE